MRIRGALVWIYPALVLAMGIGFLIWSFTQQGAADAYRGAPQCADGATTNCYELFPAVIQSVHVSQTRSGERDEVVLQTASSGSLSVTLEPSATSAPHVRTGANVTVKRYNGEITLVEVDGYGIPSTLNPAASQSGAALAGWLLVGLGLLSGGVPFFLRWRRNRAVPSAVTGAMAMDATAQPEILPSGSLGWSVRPQANLTTIGRYAFAGALLLLVTFRPLLDPGRAMWVLLFDGAIVLGLVISLVLYFLNTRFFADRQQVGKTDLFGRTKSLALRDVKAADRFSVPARYGEIKHLVIVTADGKKAFEAAGTAWDFDRLDAMCRQAGVPLTGGYDQIVGAFRVNRRVPGMASWGKQLLIGLGVLVFVIVFVILLVGPGQR